METISSSDHVDTERVLKERLSKNIRMADIRNIVQWVQTTDADSAMRMLYNLMFDADRRVSDNAAWIFIHLGTVGSRWLYPRWNALVDEVMRTTSNTKRRLLLVLLLQLPMNQDNLRTDFLDFCLSCSCSKDESTSVKTLSIKLSYEQCKYYPELLQELKSTLELMEPDRLSTGVRTVRNKVLKSIDMALDVDL